MKEDIEKQLHTSEHILGQVLKELCPGFRTTSLDIQEDKVRYDFKVDNMSKNITKKLLEIKINDIIRRDIPVKFETVSRSKARKRKIDLSLLPESTKEIRLVDIKGINVQACTGKHVKNTEEIGIYKIAKFVKKGKNSYQIVATIRNRNKNNLSTDTLILNRKNIVMNNILKQIKNKSQGKLSTQPYKGARDFYPEDMRVRNYIFNIWKKVCKRYGFEEYDFPIMEPYEIFAAKTGEEIVNEQMFTLTDRGGRRLAIRPELTPGTVRMLAQRYGQLVKPVKWFMIGNNWRAEKPQKGRGREFYQLEMNTFGVDAVEADFEIFSAMIEIMEEFGATEKQFRVYYSDRKLIKALLEETLKLDEDVQIKVRRQMDKMKKMKKEEFSKQLENLDLNNDQVERVQNFMAAKGSLTETKALEKAIPKEILRNNQGYLSLCKLQKLLSESGLDKYCEFDPSIIRGFDYSDGLVYEVFDLDPTNSRSMFGGERFDKLINIFGNYELAATGFAMGDYTLLEFLKNWKLLPTLPIETQVMVTVFNEDNIEKSFELAQKLRKEDIDTFVYLEALKLDKQLKYADKKGIPFVIIQGPDELNNDILQLKDMREKKQYEVTLEECISKINEE